MKKIAVIFASILVLIIAALVVIPYFFKDDLKAQIVNYMSQKLDAKIEIDDYDLSLFSHFPALNFRINGLKAESKESTYSIFVEKLSTELNSRNLLFDKSINVLSIEIESPSIKYKMLGDQTDIKKSEVSQIVESSDPLSADEQIDSEIAFSISQYEIKNAEIVVNDNQGNLLFHIKNLNHNGFGVFVDNILSLNTSTDIGSISAQYGNIKYLDNSQVKGEFNLDFDMNNKVYKVQENNIKLNNIELNWVGIIKQIKEDNYEIDLKFDSPNSKFRDLLDLVPNDFKKDFDKIESDGDFEIKGEVIGLLNNDLLPEIHIQSELKNAYFKYQNLSESVNDINFKLDINKPQASDLSFLRVEIPRLSFSLMKNTFNGNLVSTNLNVDPFVKAYVSTNINLDDIKYAIPLESKEDVKGIIAADISVEGFLSDLENENYDRFKAVGNIKLSDMDYKSNSLKKVINIANADVQVSPQYLHLNKFDLKIGSSDIKATGKVYKFLEYAFKNKELIAELNISSNYLSFSDIQSNEDNDSSKVEEPLKLIEIPKNISFKNNISFKKVKLGKIDIENINGSLGIKNQTAYLDNIRMKVFKGDIRMNGKYNNVDTSYANASFEFNLKEVQISEMSNSIDFVSDIAPVISTAKGQLFADLQLNTRLDKNMSPDLKSLNSVGNFKTKGLDLENSDFIEDLGSVLKIDELSKDPKVSDVNINFRIKDGNMEIDPFTLQIADLQANFGGEANIAESKINMEAGIVIPRKYISRDLNNILDNAVEYSNKIGLKVKLDEKISVNAIIKGNLSAPSYSLTYGPEKAKTPAEYIKKEAEKILNNAKKEAGKKVENKAKDLIKGLFK